MQKKGNYGLDSPAIVGALLLLGLSLLILSRATDSHWRWLTFGLGAYFLVGSAGMTFYSKVGKLRLRERLLDKVPWRGDETVLDIGCGPGLLTVGAARRLSNGTVVGVDVWNARAITGNRAASVLENAKREGVEDKVQVKEGDARALPFADSSFELVLSNFVVHEMKTREERKQMMREIARVLKPGGHVALVDLMFTQQCVFDLEEFGVETTRVPDGRIGFWISAILNFGGAQTYHVVGRKR